jgi:hypothetical protein
VTNFFSAVSKRLILVGVLIIFSYHHSRGQSDTTSMRYYFDDGGIASSRAIFKVETIAIIHGELPVLLEVFVKQNFSLELGAGVILPYYVHDFLPLLFNEGQGFKNSEFGNSFWLSSRLYMREAPESNYWMLQARRRNFVNTNVTEITFNFGKQKIFGKRWICDYGIGLGLRFQKYSQEAYIFDPDFSFTPIVPVYLRFGHIL